MTAQPIAPVIPSASGPGRHRPGGLRPARPLPLASPPDRLDVVYGFGRIDASGRVADRAVIGALGWRGGDRLTLTAGAGVMVAAGHSAEPPEANSARPGRALCHQLPAPGGFPVPV